jgi:hypothetical protein
MNVGRCQCTMRSARYPFPRVQGTAKLKAGETVVVTAAAGGTGHIAVQLALLAGCRVVAIVGGGGGDASIDGSDGAGAGETGSAAGGLGKRSSQIVSRKRAALQQLASSSAKQCKGVSLVVLERLDDLVSLRTSNLSAQPYNPWVFIALPDLRLPHGTTWFAGLGAFAASDPQDKLETTLKCTLCEMQRDRDGTGSAGWADVVFDGVGGAALRPVLLRCLAPGGRYLQVAGAGRGEMERGKLATGRQAWHVHVVAHGRG